MHLAFLDVADSYYKNRTLLHYRQARTILDSTELDYQKNIDGSTLVLLCLADIPYERSPYTGISYQKGNARWAVDYFAKGVRNAAQLCQMLTENGHRLPLPTEDPTTYTFHSMKVMGIRPGDLIFYSKEPNRRYMNISHVAIVRGFEEHPEYPILEAAMESEKVPFPVRYSSWERASSRIVAICRPIYF